MNKKYYIIYKITNIINGMIYIGQHTTSDINDGYMGSGVYLKMAINKYGIDNFKKEILFYCDSFDEMNNKEREIVNEEFIKRTDTYNISVGGTFGWKNVFKYKSKEEQYKIHRRAITKLLNKIKTMNKQDYDAYRNLLSERAKTWHKKHKGIFKGENNPMYHHQYTKETIQKMSNSHKGKLNSQYGLMWITNPITHKNTRIKKNSKIPSGWIKGRWCNKNNQGRFA